MIKVTLIEHTPNPEQLVASAARLCYSYKSVEEILQTFSSDEEKTAELVNKLINLGHGSPFEHVTFTFGIEGVSRAMTHQLVRHRIASYSQKSQRYVNEKQFDYIIPLSVKKAHQEDLYINLMEKIQDMYNLLISAGVPKEDARYILPNATETKIYVTMNIRSLVNFFNHRCCSRAQWEIRAVAYEMLDLVRKVAPNIFKNVGAHCRMLGYCPEGDMSCGIYPTLDKLKINK